MTLVRSLRALLVLTILSSLGLSLGMDARAESKPKVFHFARTSAEKTLDPQNQLDEASGDLILNLYDRLLEYDYLKRPYTLAPNLAAKLPELSADKLTLTW